MWFFFNKVIQRNFDTQVVAPELYDFREVNVMVGIVVNEGYARI